MLRHGPDGKGVNLANLGPRSGLNAPKKKCTHFGKARQNCIDIHRVVEFNEFIGSDYTKFLQRGHSMPQTLRHSQAFTSPSSPLLAPSRQQRLP
mmetsp:Transcript_3488/g.3847  ORF Transcript_3488/g.3847 Transcript_3488/m.3847 type:complete len:94 (-) Transcript_3488:156-437(-)